MQSIDLQDPATLVGLGVMALVALASFLYVLYVVHNDPENSDDIALSLKSHRHNHKYDGIR